MGKKVLQFFAPFKPSPWPLHMPAHSVVNSPSTPSSALTTSRTSPTSDKPALAAGPPCSVSLTYSSVPSVESSPTSSTNTPVQSGARRPGLSSAVSQWAVSNSPSVCSTLTMKLPCSASSPVLLSSWMPPMVQTSLSCLTYILSPMVFSLVSLAPQEILVVSSLPLSSGTTARITRRLFGSLVLFQLVLMSLFDGSDRFLRTRLVGSKLLTRTVFFLAVLFDERASVRVARGVRIEIGCIVF